MRWRCDVTSHDKQKREGFIRAMSRELLVHNPKINDVDDAIWLAEELLAKTPVPSNASHTHGDDTDGDSDTR